MRLNVDATEAFLSPLSGRSFSQNASWLYISHLQLLIALQILAQTICGDDIFD
jgi:hypothetical protein